MPPQGKLLASVNNRVQLYGWVARDGGARELAPECGHSGHTCALYVETRGDSVLVGALMKQGVLNSTGHALAQFQLAQGRKQSCVAAHPSPGTLPRKAASRAYR